MQQSPNIESDAEKLKEGFIEKMKCHNSKSNRVRARQIKKGVAS